MKDQLKLICIQLGHSYKLYQCQVGLMFKIEKVYTINDI